MSGAVKKELILEGLSCATCASKIEKKLTSLEGVKSASVNFVTNKMIIEINHQRDLNRIIEQASTIADSIEPGINIIDRAIDKVELKEKQMKNKIKLIKLGIGAILFLSTLILNYPFWVEFFLYFISYLVVGGGVLLKAVKNIYRGQIFDENFLMSVATIGAFSIGEFPEGVAVMLFYQVGMFFEDIAINHSRKSIRALMDIRPDFANLKIGDEVKRVSPDEIIVGDIIIVKPGEKIPLDGKILEGNSFLDMSTLTGESLPREAEPGNDILSGSINKNGLLIIEVTKVFGESTVSKILDLVQNASSKKAPTENFITKFAGYYTPIVVYTAVALAVIPPLVVPGATFSEWINRALVFLVVSCPCALVISIPLGFFGGIGGASKNGILIKGSNYLEALNNVDTIVFDKTGTLTKGVFKVTKVADYMKDATINLLEYAAYAESYSNHPIALSIIKEYGKPVNKSEIEHCDEISGHGIKIFVKGKEILIGNAKLMAAKNIPFEKADEIGTIVYMAIDGKYAGYIVISDEIKSDAQNTIKALKDIGIKRLVMLTGDSKSVGEKIGRQIGIDEVYTGLLPHQKVEKLEMLVKHKSPKGKILFVGDGINDAPVLARADIGVAMGGLGSDAAIEAADIVLMTDEPSKLVTAIKIARRTRKIIWQNILFAMGIKAIVLLMGAGGIATIWEAVFADVGVTILAVLNATRVMKVDKN